MEAYEQDLYESEVYLKLREAEIEAGSTTQRHSLAEVMDSMERIITEAELEQCSVTGPKGYKCPYLL
jgi:hypothetical protein